MDAISKDACGNDAGNHEARGLLAEISECAHKCSALLSSMEISLAAFKVGEIIWLADQMKPLLGVD
jgi:hypothetical protein